MSIYACILYGLIAVFLLALKLAGLIAWPWEWVLAPLWAPWALAVAVLMCLGVTALITGLTRP